MEKEQIELEGANKYGPYSAGVKAGGTIWLSGQIDVEAGDDVKAQTQGALDKIDALLAAAQLSKHNLCFAQVLSGRHQRLCSNERSLRRLGGRHRSPTCTSRFRCSRITRRRFSRNCGSRRMPNIVLR